MILHSQNSKTSREDTQKEYPFITIERNQIFPTYLCSKLKRLALRAPTHKMSVIVLQHKDCIWHNTPIQNQRKVITVAHVVLVEPLYLNCDKQRLFHFLNSSEIAISNCFLTIKKKLSQSCYWETKKSYEQPIPGNFSMEECCSILNFNQNRASVSHKTSKIFKGWI